MMASVISDMATAVLPRSLDPKLIQPLIDAAACYGVIPKRSALLNSSRRDSPGNKTRHLAATKANAVNPSKTPRKSKLFQTRRSYNWSVLLNGRTLST
jgi:hypothetical protein